MDFCYWANGLVLFYIWCRPTDPVLFQVSAATVCGDGVTVSVGGDGVTVTV